MRTGKGVRGAIDGSTVAIGNAALLTELAIDAGALADRSEELRGDGQTVMFVVADGKLAGLVGVASHQELNAGGDPCTPQRGHPHRHVDG